MRKGERGDVEEVVVVVVGKGERIVSGGAGNEEERAEAGGGGAAVSAEVASLCRAAPRPNRGASARRDARFMMRLLLIPGSA